MEEGPKSVCAPHAPRAGLLCVGVWNHSTQTSSAPPWSISEQWIISVYTFPIKSSHWHSISGTAWNSYRKRSAITEQTKKKCRCFEHHVSESVRWLLGKPSAQIQTTDWKHPHCLQHTFTHEPLLICHLLKFSAFTATTAVCPVILA